MAGLFSVMTSRQHELEMRNPAFCEELRIRDILDEVAVTTGGSFAAAYELSGLHSQYHTEEMRNRAKESLEAALRSMPGYVASGGSFRLIKVYNRPPAFR